MDIAKGGLIEAMFDLPYRFAIPRVMYESGLVVFPDIEKENLKNLGLRQGACTTSEMAVIRAIPALEWRYLGFHSGGEIPFLPLPGFQGYRIFHESFHDSARPDARTRR